VLNTDLLEHYNGYVAWELKEDVSLETLDVLFDPKVAAEHVELQSAFPSVMNLIP
jgi:hypothetical protein